MLKLNVNGKNLETDADPQTPLLWVLRDSLGLTGTKYGCGMALCGACTVHLDGQPIRSCVMPVGAIGAAENHDDRGPVRRIAVTRCRGRGSSSTSLSAATASPARSCRPPRCLAQNAEPERRRHRRGDVRKYLPLRHLPAHPRGDPPRG